MSLNDVIERIEEESSELDLRLGDLLSFLDNPMFNRLSIGHRELLKKQADAMMSYQHILFARLYLLKSEAGQISADA